MPRVRNRREKSLKNNNNNKKKKGGQRVLSGSPEVDNGWIPLLVEALYSPKRRAAAEAAELSLSLSWKYYPGEEGKKKKGDGRLPFSI